MPAEGETVNPFTDFEKKKEESNNPFDDDNNFFSSLANR